MRRTLTVLVATAAFVLPAAAASASTEGAVSGPGTNASCNNGKGGNYDWTGMSFNGKGKAGLAGSDCTVVVPSDPVLTPDEPIQVT